jgi:thioredoxin-related protein
MKLLLVYILLITAPAVEWLDNFNTAKDLAAKDHKYILISFSGSDWCAPCIKMKKEVFENESFVNLAEQKLVLVRADFPRSKKNQLPGEQVKHNEVLAEKYNPSGKFPFTVLVDSNGNVIKTWDGYVFGSYEKFIENLNSTIPKP